MSPSLRLRSRLCPCTTQRWGCCSRSTWRCHSHSWPRHWAGREGRALSGGEEKQFDGWLIGWWLLSSGSVHVLARRYLSAPSPRSSSCCCSCCRGQLHRCCTPGHRWGSLICTTSRWNSNTSAGRLYPLHTLDRTRHQDSTAMSLVRNSGHSYCSPSHQWAHMVLKEE